jgi:hypothetical protein
MTSKAQRSAVRLERREFIVTVGAVTAAAALPLSLGLISPGVAVGAAEPSASLGDWSIDDMWGVYPRPSEPIGYGRPREDGELTAAVHPADAQFVV